MSKDRKLSRQQKGLLKILQGLDGEIKSSDLCEDERISTYYSGSQAVNRALRTLEEKPFKFVECKKGKRNANLWSLTEKGERKVRKLEKQKHDEEKDGGDTFFQYGNAVQVFEEFVEGPGKEQFEKAMTGRRFFYLDYQDLDRFDVELADELLKNPDQVIAACREVLTSHPDVSDSIDIRVRNISDIDTKEISELSAENIGELVTVEGVLQSGSGVGAELVSAIFECAQCGQRYSKEQEGVKLKSPYKCEDCGSRKFEPVDRTHKTVRVVNIKEKPGKRNPDNIVTKLVGKIAEDKSKSLNAAGSGIKVTGYLESVKRKRNAKQLDLQLKANNVTIEDEKWNSLEISSEEEKEIWNISERTDLVEYLSRSFAADKIKHMQLAKEAFLMWLLGRTGEGNLHVMLIGEPGTAKTHLGKWADDNLPRTVRAVGAGSTGIGLTAAVRKDELTGDWVAEGGSIAMADDGFHITDEIDKVEVEDLSKMNDALSDQEINLSKGTIEATISANVSEFSIGNPTKANFDKHEERYKQIPIPDDKADFKDRFDVMLGVARSDLEDEEEIQKERDKVRMILHRDQDNDVDPNEGLDVLDKDMLVKYIAYAQRINPRLTKEAATKIEDLYFKIKRAEAEEENLWDKRRVSSLKRLSIAYARMFLSEEVEEKHVELAASFLRRCFNSLDFNIGEDSFDSISRAESKRLDKVREKINELEDDNGVEVQKVVDNLYMDEESAEEVIQKLKNEGELFDTKRGKVKTI